MKDASYRAEDRLALIWAVIYMWKQQKFEFFHYTNRQLYQLKALQGCLSTGCPKRILTEKSLMQSLSMWLRIIGPFPMTVWLWPRLNDRLGQRSSYIKFTLKTVFVISVLALIKYLTKGTLFWFRAWGLIIHHGGEDMVFWWRNDWPFVKQRLIS